MNFYNTSKSPIHFFIRTGNHRSKFIKVYQPNDVIRRVNVKTLIVDIPDNTKYSEFEKLGSNSLLKIYRMIGWCDALPPSLHESYGRIKISLLRTYFVAPNTTFETFFDYFEDIDSRTLELSYPHSM